MKVKVKEVHTRKIFFTDSLSKKEKSFTCPKDMLQWRHTNPSGALCISEKFRR